MAKGRVISAVLTLKDKGFSTNAKKASSALTATQRQAKHAQNTVTGFGKSAASSFKSVAAGATSIVGAIGVTKALSGAFNMVKSSLTSAFDRIDVMENFERTMTTLTGSADKAKSALEATRESVTGTAYGLDVAAKSVQDFVTRGMDVDKATNTMKAWGDAVAFYGDGSNEQLASVSDALAKMYSTGKVSMDQVNRLYDAGIAGPEMYAQATKRDLGAVQKDLSSGKISAEDFIDVVGKAMMEGTNGVEKIAGAAKDAGGSWGNTFANMRAAVTRGVEDVVLNIDKMLTDNGLPEMREMVAQFGSKFEDVLKKAGTKIPVVTDYLVGMYDKAKPGIDWIKDTGLPAIKDGIGYVTDKSKEMYHFISDNWSKIGPVVAGIAATIATYKIGVVAVTAATTTWRTVTAAAQVATALLNGTLVVSPLGWVALAIGGVVTAGIALYKNWDIVKEKAGQLWQKLLDNPMLALVAGPIGALIAGGISLYKNWDTIKEKASILWSVLTTSFSSMKENVVTKFTEMKDGAAQKFGDIVQAARDLPGKIGEGIMKNITDATSSMTKLAEGLIERFKDALGIKSPSKVFYDMAGWIVKGLTNGLSAENLKSLGTNVFKDFAGGAFKTLDAIKGFFSGEAALANFKPGAGVQQWAGLAAQALQMTGQYSEANLQRLLMQMGTESGGNPAAINLWDINAKRGIPSKGLMQVIDPTFRAYAMPGFDKNIYDPLSNILASIRYSVSRYGSLTRAWRGKGYAQGGQITSTDKYLVGERGPEIVDLPVGSRVHNNQDSRRMKGGGHTINININGLNKSTQEIINELVPALKLRLENL